MLWEGAWTSQLTSQKGSVVVDESLRWRHGGLRSVPLLVETLRQLGLADVTVYWPLPYTKIRAIERAFKLGGVEIRGTERKLTHTSSGPRIVIARQVDEDREQYLSSLATECYEREIPTLFVIDSEEITLSSGPRFIEKFAFTTTTYKHVWEMNRRHGFVKSIVLRTLNLAFHEIAGGLGEESIPLSDLFVDPRLTTKLPWSYQLSEIRRESDDLRLELYMSLRHWVDVPATLEALGEKDLFGTHG